MVSVVGFLHVFGDGERGEVPRTPLQICDMILDVKLKALIGISVRDKTEIPTNVQNSEYKNDCSENRSAYDEAVGTSTVATFDSRRPTVD